MRAASAVCEGDTDTDDTDTDADTDDTDTVLYDLDLYGEDWEFVHNGEDFYLNVVRDSDYEVVATDSAVIDSSGTVSMSFTGILDTSESYTLDYYADHDSDGICSPYPADHVWHDALAAFTGDTSATIDHSGSTIDSDGCDSF